MTVKKIITIIIGLGILIFIVIINNQQVVIDNRETDVINYNEKINQFKAYEFDKNDQLVFEIKAKSWVSYIHKPDLLTKPIIKVYGEYNYQISADFAEQLQPQIIKLMGNIKIIAIDKKTHNFATESLLIDLSKKYLYSKTKVKYFSTDNTINADGIKIFNTEKLIQLLGKVSIQLKDNNKIDSHDISIKQYNNQDYIFSEKLTNYQTELSMAEAKNGFYLHNNQLKLFGQVSLKQKEATIVTTDLIIKNNIWQAVNSSQYTDKNTIVNANTMVYDTLNEVTTLQQNVIAVYTPFVNQDKITIAAGKVIIDKQAGMSHYVDNVVFGKQGLKLEASELKMTRDEQYLIHHKVVAFGSELKPVTYSQATNSVINATAQKAIYTTQNKMIQLMGNAYLSQDDYEFRAQKINYDIIRDEVSTQGSQEQNSKLKIKL